MTRLLRLKGRRHVAFFVWATLATACATGSRPGGESSPVDESYPDQTVPATATQNGNSPITVSPSGPQGGNIQLVTPSPNAVVSPPAPVTTTPAPTSPQAPLSLGDGSTRILGRTDTDVTQLTWPGSGISAAFTGKQMTLQVSATDGNNYLSICVDGNAPSIVPVNGAQQLTVGPLPQGTHTVTAIKTQESRLGNLKVVAVASDGVAAPLASTGRRIEVVGDSIALGYGIAGTAPCANTAALEDATTTFGALAATAVGAEYSLIAVSGKGVLRNDISDTSPNPITLPQIYGWQQANNGNVPYSFPAAAAPQAIVVALGSNDFEWQGFDAKDAPYPARRPLDVNAFVQSYTAFVRSIRAHNPTATLFLCSSPMLTDTYPTAAEAQHRTHLQALQSVAQAVGQNVTVVDFPAMATAVPKGCGGHPNRATHAQLGQILAAALRTGLGW